MTSEVSDSSALAAVPSVVMEACSMVTSNLAGGPYGIAALTATAFTVLVPVTQYKNQYAFTVGYGLTMAALGIALRSSFSIASGSLSDVLSGLLVFYGVRLASYLSLRNVWGWNGPPRKAFEQPPRLKRIPFAASIAVFYAFLATPVLYALRAPPVKGSLGYNVAVGGAVLAGCGVLMETVADAHKLIVKQRHGGKENTFVGPTTGVYRITRHPNYTGEASFWLGLFVAGLGSFGRSAQAYLASSAGLFGIVQIMKSATKNLEGRQQDKYGGQEAYEKYKKDVPAPFIPFVKG